MYDSRLIWREPVSTHAISACIGGFGELGEHLLDDVRAHKAIQTRYAVDQMYIESASAVTNQNKCKYYCSHIRPINSIPNADNCANNYITMHINEM